MEWGGKERKGRWRKVIMEKGEEAEREEEGN